MKIKAVFISILLSIKFLSSTVAAPLNLSDSPINLTKTVAPLTLLVMGRDHKLYYEAYNDASDITGDGVPNTRFDPAIVYFGYFDSHKCYYYSRGKFSPAGATENGTECAGNWSGNFLNYVTTSRIDALRKVLYGGYRYRDSTRSTVLERSYIPQDAHSWGKSYTSVGVDGYDISRFTPFSKPTYGRRHLFANTTLRNDSDGSPLLRVALNMPYQIWEWLSIERPVADDEVAVNNNDRRNIRDRITDFKVRVRVCVPNMLEENCRAYRDGTITSYKPVGLLQELGENEKMKFGLLTGSYGRNLSGGVLRKNIETITDEVNLNTGQFTSTNGIIKTLDRLRIIGFGSKYSYDRNCGWIFNRDILDGECRNWGNPIAEMMYESMRYFAGKKRPTPDFVYSGGDDDELRLPKPSWKDPYAENNNPWCAKPNILLISDIYPSHDTDKVPGSAFSSFSGDLPGMNVSRLGDTIWQHEMGGSGRYFIGESLSDSNQDSAPTAKMVTSFGNIRGLVPEEPNKQGGYYTASVAYYGWLNDVNSSSKKAQKIHTYAVALASPLPEIVIPVNGHTIKLIPFGKSVGGCMGVNGEQGEFQPTNTIVDFYVESLTNNSGTFRINFEDAQQGADHDMDALVKYRYRVNPDNTVTITLDSDYAAGCVIQHMGYVISGTTEDGVYLEVRDSDTKETDDVDYYLDTPNTEGEALPLHAERTFTPGVTASAKTLKNPLWYAAKWGGFEDSNGNNVPDVDKEWDKDGDGVPDNYFLVTNALHLKDRLAKAFNNIIKRSSSRASATVSSTILSADTTIFQVLFNSSNWTGHLLAFKMDPTTGELNKSGSAKNGAQWDAAERLTQLHWHTGRQILTYKPEDKSGSPFTWSQLSTAQKTMLQKNPITNSVESDRTGETRLNYIRGDQSDEVKNGGSMRNRDSLLGDIIDSSPLYVGEPKFTYFDSWPQGSAENDHLYSEFKSSSVKNRPPVIYVGSNDGMLHAIDVSNGNELFAYIPSAVIKNLNHLTSVDYEHKYYVNASANYGDVFIHGAWHTVLIGGLARGGKGIYALDITDPTSVRQANAAQKVLWEFNHDSKDSNGQPVARDLGYTYGKPAIVRMANGKWAAIFGNGYNNTEGVDGSVTGNAVLYIVDIETGQLIKKLDTGVGLTQDPTQSNRPNGLSTPVVLDANGDYIADTVYAGDLYGNLWKFNINDPNPSNWKVALNGQPLFVAERSFGDNTQRQPITTRPTISRVPNKPGVFQIYFGTGKFIESNDKSDMSIQSFYAVQDANQANPIALSSLVKQSFYSEFDIAKTSGGSTTVRSSTKHPILAQNNGWYIDLITTIPEGERVVSDPIIRREKLVFTTMIPKADPCEAGGDGWLVELDAIYGRPTEYPPFDLDGDRVFTQNDNDIQSEKAVSAVKSEIGIINTPAIVSDNDREFKITSGSSGGIQSTVENPGSIKQGRQSWQQIR